jgi:competence CoiA-like predicted nuclease
MLQAMLKNGKLITPAMLRKEELKELKQAKENFYCPSCKEKVILRAGDSVIAHFAHQKEAICSTKGGEGPYHEHGKLLLYQWFMHQGLHVELEAYLRGIDQRPDLLLSVNGKRIAIEYQCSRISNKVIRDRTEGYHRLGIHVIWVLGARLLKRTGTNTLRADAFTQMMIHQFSPDYPLSLFYFCPLTMNVIKVQDLIFTSKTKALGKFIINPLNQFDFPSLLSKDFLTKQVTLSYWKKEKIRFRTQRRGKLYGDALEWHKWLYHKGIHFERVSSYVYLPVRQSFQINIPNWIWQSRILYEIIANKPLGTVFTLEACHRIIRKHHYPASFFPSISCPADPIHEYFQLLTKGSLLEALPNNTFVKRVDIDSHHHIKSAIDADMRLLEKLFIDKHHKSSKKEG